MGRPKKEKWIFLDKKEVNKMGESIPRGQFNNLVNSLTEIGLNRYEAKVYLTLIEEGLSTAKNISDITGIPYGKVYEVINSLTSKGFSVILPTKPLKCRAIPPSEAIIHVRKRTNEKLEKIEKIVLSELNPLFIKTKEFIDQKCNFVLLNGRANINKQIEKLIINSDNTLNIFTSENGLKRLVFYKQLLKDAHNRNTKIFISTKITRNNIEDAISLNFCDIRHVGDTKNHLFSNGNESIIIESVPDDDNIIHGRDYGIFINSNSFTKFFNELFISKFKTGKKLNEKIKELNIKNVKYLK